MSWLACRVTMACRGTMACFVLFVRLGDVLAPVREDNTHHHYSENEKHDLGNPSISIALPAFDWDHSIDATF